MRKQSTVRGRAVPRRATLRESQKRETHDRILKSASSIARREGLRAASVPRVMSGAGLTVGGFYAHFDSKNSMDIEVIRGTLGSLSRWLSGLEGSSGLAWVQRAMGRYLSAAHRDSPDGCAYPAVLSEIASAPPNVRQAFAEAFEQRVKAFEGQVPRVKGVSQRERALATLALAIGGLLLARASAGDPLSDEMLTACKKWALPELDSSSPRA
jgi:TetR/AcrR family transcriptional repressor of nem operon